MDAALIGCLGTADCGHCLALRSVPGNNAAALDLPYCFPPLSRTAASPNRLGDSGPGFWIAAGVILLVGSGLRFYGITRESAWVDELWTLSLTDPSLSLSEFWRRLLNDVHPPLYYMLMRGWAGMFGQSDLAARLPSAICSVLMMAAGGAAPLSRLGRLALMALLAMSPGAVEYAQEARSYAMLMLLTALLTVLCAKIVAGPFEHRDSPANLTGLTLAGIIASYTHYFGFLFAFAAGSVVFVARRNWRAGLSLAAITASFFCWLVYDARYLISAPPEAVTWIASFPLSATGAWFTRLWLGNSRSLLALGIFAATLFATPRFRRMAQHHQVLAIGAVLAVMTAAAAIISWRVPIFSARNLFVVLPALYLMIAALAADAANLSSVAAAAGVAVLLVLMWPSLEWQYTGRSKEQWRESAAFILAQPGCAKGPIYVYGDKTPYKYLVGKARPELQLIEIPLGKVPATRSQPAGDCPIALWAGKISPDEFAEMLSQLPPRSASCRKVREFYWAFVVTRDPDDDNCREIP